MNLKGGKRVMERTEKTWFSIAVYHLVWHISLGYMYDSQYIASFS